jgi:hypothetical protein
MIFISRIHKREEEEKKMVLQKVWYPDGHPAGSLTRFSTKVQTTVSVPPKAYSRGTRLPMQGALLRPADQSCASSIRLVYVIEKLAYP